jgi:hypothetical protein
MSDSRSSPRDDPPDRVSVVISDQGTTEHALRLVVSGNKKKKGCPDLSITCEPTLYSCEPVAQCASYDIPAPGCSPLKCDPVATQPSG